MNRLLGVFDYIFFRVFKAYERKDKHPDIYASGVVSLIQFFTLLSIGTFFKLFFEFNVANKQIIIPLLIVIIGLNWYRYERNFDFKSFEEQWQNESPEKRRKRGWLVVCYLAISILIPVLYGTLKHNFNLF